MTNRIDHTAHTHDNTPAARKACRVALACDSVTWAAAVDGKICLLAKLMPGLVDLSRVTGGIRTPKTNEYSPSVLSRRG